MKKLFIKTIMVLSLMALPMAAMAGPGSGGDSGGYAGGFGIYDISTFNIGGGYMVDGEPIPNGFADGIGAGGGVAGGHADGFILNGSVEGELTSVAGGFGSSEAYRLRKHDVFGNNAPDKFIGVGSRSNAYAITGASFKIKVDPARGFGKTDAFIGGIAGQGTLNVSGVGRSPSGDWKTGGFTGGIAGQSSVGGFVGGGYALSGPDCKYYCRRVDSKAGAGAGAEIEMSGFSVSESYRFMNDDGDVHTEGMGTRVAAGTEVTSMGYDYDWDRGFSKSGAYLCGGFVAAGGASSYTVQTLPGVGMAAAHASGSYSGAGSLGGNYSGSVNGYTGTSITTITTLGGMNGSISSSSAGMSVSSSYNHGNMPN